jgi:hypothetical protein
MFIWKLVLSALGARLQRAAELLCGLAQLAAFHTPSGIRLYRVGAAGHGEGAIYEGYKPGTEPGANRHPGPQGPSDEIPMRSHVEERPLTRDTTGAAPATGTGGLY